MVSGRLFFDVVLLHYHREYLGFFSTGLRNLAAKRLS